VIDRTPSDVINRQQPLQSALSELHRLVQVELDKTTQ
jgi:hypothetical protein